MSRVVFAEERFKDYIEEMKPILQNHWEEIALHKDKIKLCPDYKRYAALDAMGALHTVTARLEGKLVGYFTSFVSTHLHYSDHLFASNDILFIDPSLRGGSVAKEMVEFAEEKLKLLGVDVISIHMKTHAPFDKLCESLDYKNVERLYSKFVGE